MNMASLLPPYMTALRRASSLRNPEKQLIKLLKNTRKKP
jgi:hypothetical protein